MQEINRDINRAVITNITTNYLLRKKRFNNILEPFIMETATFLQNNKNLLTIKSDKGNATVVIDKEGYKQNGLDRFGGSTHTLN